MVEKLFLPRNPASADRSAYSACRDHVTKREVRDLLEAAWKTTQPYLGDDEGDFLNRFRGPKFHSAAWELYLRAMLVAHGFELRKTKATGPDIRTNVGDRTVWIEAAVVEPGDPARPDSVIPRGEETSRALFPVKQLLLRLSNTIQQKLDQVNGWRSSGVVAASDAVVVALNYGTILDADLHDMEVPTILKAVFGIGDPTLIIPLFGEGERELVFPPRPSVTKASGAEVSMETFKDASSSGLTGILYARQLVWNLRWDARRDLGYVHNPMATPLPESWLSVRAESFVVGGAVETRIAPREPEAEWGPRPLDRPSRSAAATRKAERDRIAAMSPSDRAILALRLGARVGK